MYKYKYIKFPNKLILSRSKMGANVFGLGEGGV